MSSESERTGPWQQRLQEACNNNGYRQPVFQIASDRRGGRTAWSSTVEVQGLTIPARFWYDGQYIHNAKEDAAEVALQRIDSGWVQQQTTAAQQNWQGYNHHNSNGASGA